MQFIQLCNNSYCTVNMYKNKLLKKKVIFLVSSSNVEYCVCTEEGCRLFDACGAVYTTKLLTKPLHKENLLLYTKKCRPYFTFHRHQHHDHAQTSQQQQYPHDNNHHKHCNYHHLARLPEQGATV